MSNLELPAEPTPEILDAIRASLYAPLSALLSREATIYRAIVRAVTPRVVVPVWKVEGSGREAEPTSHTLSADSEAEIGKATLALLKDGFTTITVKAEQVKA